MPAHSSIQAAAGVAVSRLNSNATAHIRDTAKIKAGKDFVVLADTVDRNVTLASAAAKSDGFLGIAAAVSVENGTTNALVDGIVDVGGDARNSSDARKASLQQE